jgi:hypothetical protein
MRAHATAVRVPVLLTGIHLLRTGEFEPNLVRLNQTFRLPHFPDLIDRKVRGEERCISEDGDFGFHEREFDRLLAELEAVASNSTLPKGPTAGRHCTTCSFDCACEVRPDSASTRIVRRSSPLLGSECTAELRFSALKSLTGGERAQEQR